MIITPHLLLGAAIGAKIKNPGLIIVLGILGHIILDKIPHWDYGKRIECLSDKKIYDKDLLVELLKIGVDGVIALIIVIPIIWLKKMGNLECLLFIFVGVFASLLPDFLLYVVKLFSCFSKYKNFAKKYIDFHNKFLHYPKHIKEPTLLGLGTEILVSVIAILIILL